MRPSTKRNFKKFVNVLILLLGVGMVLGLALGFFELKKQKLDKVSSPTYSAKEQTFTKPVIVDVGTCVKRPWGKCKMPDASWKQYPKDLYLGKAWFMKKFLIYKEVEVSNIGKQKVVVNFASYFPTANNKRLPAEMSADSYNGEFKTCLKYGWVEKDMKLGLWVKRVPFKSYEKTVTTIKVLYGSDFEYYVPNWFVTTDFLREGADVYSLPKVLFRLGPKVDVPKPVLKFNSEKRFRIAQVSDLHMSTGKGECNESPSFAGLDNWGECHGDRITLEFLNGALSSEGPDFIVFSGDLVYGDRSPDPETSLIKAVMIAMKYKIPFSVIWGNHDSEGPLSNGELTDLVMELPYSVMEHGPSNIQGDGNYVVTVSPEDSNHPALSMYLLDTHGRINEPGHFYGWIRREQAQWVEDVADDISTALKDYEGVPLAMAFLHIPLPQFLISSHQQRVGKYREPVSCARLDEGILSAFFKAGVSVINAGHDHANDFCQYLMENKVFELEKDLYLCYAGGAGYGGYGGYPDENGEPFRRRIRLFDVDLTDSSIITFHRVDRLVGHSNKFILVDEGYPSPPSVVFDLVEFGVVGIQAVDPQANRFDYLKGTPAEALVDGMPDEEPEEPEEPEE